jgi:hypothetical protein
MGSFDVPLGEERAQLDAFIEEYRGGRAPAPFHHENHGRTGWVLAAASEPNTRRWISRR